MNILYDIAIVSTGLFAGLMMTLVFILQKQWIALNKEEWFSTFKTFLIAAKGHPLVTMLTFAGFIPSWWLGYTALGNDTMSAVVLLASGAIFFIGCFLVTIILNLPIYERVIGWRSFRDATDWKWVQRRFLLLNVIRFASSLGAFVLLIIAR